MDQIETLQELYVDELKDLWSANDQMAKALKKITTKASDARLKAFLQTSLEGIAKHTEMLKGLIEGQDEKVTKEHCKGMEGLAAEALKHTIEEPPAKGPVLDAAIITQFQRMTHYGVAGFGTAGAFAKTLGFKDDATQIAGAVSDMKGGDKIVSSMADAAINVQAAKK